MKVTGTFALQEVVEASHRYVERVNDVEAELCRRFYCVRIMLH